MAHPKRQHSKQRSRKRRTHDGATIPTSIDLKSQGGQQGVNHRIDPVTGYYKGRQIIDMAAKAAKKNKKAE